MPTERQILIVDDDPLIRETLADFLSAEGFGVGEAATAAEARAALGEGPCDLVLLDINLPDMDGLTFAREVCASHDAAIIMVTGKGDLIDRVVGLELGADDYIAKPFQLREVLARVRAVLRRMRRGEGAAQAVAAAAAESGEAGKLKIGGSWLLDLGRRTLQDVDGVTMALTGGEFALLAAFVERPNRVLSRDQLADLTKGHNWTAYDRSIDTQVSRLRRKLERQGKVGELIRTVRGEGYAFIGDLERLR
jgi:DNA-binding response OmpR family regulator